jgi:hypothetical protein
MGAIVGARELLENRLSWLAVAPLLKGPANALLVSLGIDAAAQSAGQIAQRARHWLLEWRTNRSDAPFFLYVDFRISAEPSGAESLAALGDSHLGELLKQLEMLEASSSTLVVAIRAPAGDAGPPDHSLRVAVRAPGRWRLPTRSTTLQTVHGHTLGQFLLAASRADLLSAVALPSAH